MSSAWAGTLHHPSLLPLVSEPCRRPPPCYRVSTPVASCKKWTASVKTHGHLPALKCSSQPPPVSLTAAEKKEGHDHEVPRSTLIWRAAKLPIYSVALVPLSLGRGSNFRIGNASINIGAKGGTIHFGGLAIPLNAASAIVVPVHGRRILGHAGRPNSAIVSARCAHGPMPNRRNSEAETIVEVSRKRISVFDRLGDSEAQAVKRTITEGRVYVLSRNAPITPSECSTSATSLKDGMML